MYERVGTLLRWPLPCGAPIGDSMWSPSPHRVELRRRGPRRPYPDVFIQDFFICRRRSERCYRIEKYWVEYTDVVFRRYVMCRNKCGIYVWVMLSALVGCDDDSKTVVDDTGITTDSLDADIDVDTDGDGDTTAPGTTINGTGFETGEDESSYTMESWIADGFNPRWVQGFNQDRAHIDTAQAHTGDSSLRIDYPAGAYLPDASGAQVPLDFPAQKQVHVTYWLRFSENFEWGQENEGGKLPGLGGGDNCSGGSAAHGPPFREQWQPGGQPLLLHVPWRQRSHLGSGGGLPRMV